MLSPAERQSIAERAMTVDDWRMLRWAVQCYAESLKSNTALDYLALRDKCDVRVQALKEGRVLP